MAQNKTSAEAALDNELLRLGLDPDGNPLPAGDANPGDTQEESTDHASSETDVESEEDQQPEGPHHNWEKRAKDSQRSFSKERNARLEAERKAAEAVNEIARQRAEFEKVLARYTPSAQATNEQAAPSVDDEVLENFRDIYPEIAAGVEEAMRPVRNEVEQLRKERLERDVRDHTAKFLSEAGSDPRLKSVDINAIVGTDELADWLEKTGGYSARVMNNTFDPAFGFTPKDVADVIHRFVQETGNRPTVTARVDNEPPAPRPQIPTNGSSVGNDNVPTDIFSLAELQNLQPLADKAGRLSIKLGKPELLGQFDEKLDRSLRFYDAQAKKRTQNR